jgi:hypothetical protein
MRAIEPYQEEGIDRNVEVERREGVAGVIVAPEAYLQWNRNGRVQE